MLQVTCLRSVNIEINMNMNSGQGYGHAYFLCKDRQIPRLSVFIFHMVRTRQRYHRFTVQGSPCLVVPNIRPPLVLGCMPSSSHAIRRASASEIFFFEQYRGRSPPTINLKRSHYKKVPGIPGRELHEREFGDRVYRRGNLKTELQIGLATFATHGYMAGFSCICPYNC